jgi:hypothetical protein
VQAERAVGVKGDDMSAARMLAVLAAMLVVVGAAGCHSTYVAGNSSEMATFEFGSLKAVLGKDVDTLSAASEKALAQLNMQVVNKRKDKLVGEVEAYTSDGKTVTVSMNSLSEGVTKLTIHVGGMMGDEAVSRAVYAKILKYAG